jgi:hypothetical protein
MTQFTWKMTTEINAYPFGRQVQNASPPQSHMGLETRQLTQSPIYSVPGVPYLDVKRPRSEANKSPSKAHIKNDKSCTSNPPSVFVAHIETTSAT